MFLFVLFPVYYELLSILHIMINSVVYVEFLIDIFCPNSQYKVWT